MACNTPDPTHASLPTPCEARGREFRGAACAELIRDGMMAEAAVDKAFNRAEEIFSKFTFG
jgi:hypothetical protein